MTIEIRSAFGISLQFPHLRLFQEEDARVKRVNLLEYFELADAIADAKKALTAPKATALDLFFELQTLQHCMAKFVKDDNGFTVCKHVANEVVADIKAFVRNHLQDDEGKFDSEKYNIELEAWNYTNISSRIAVFRNVFESECRNVDVYSVEEVSIYKTSSLVWNGSHFIPKDVREKLQPEVLNEFNNAGRCLAFSLPTACGFHSLRGLELVMGAYLKCYGVNKKMNSWSDYVSAAKKLVESQSAGPKPSSKVATMLDRMRELDRNPLMHPRNVLDDVSADMLFRLAAITVVEMVKDMPTADQLSSTLPPLAAGRARLLPPELINHTVENDIDGKADGAEPAASGATQ